MTPYVAFVRAVMIGREGLHRHVLLDLFADAGAAAARSYISTGNVSFELSEDQLPGAVTEIESGISKVIGRRTDVFIRRLDELVAMVERSPFDAVPYDDPQESLVIFFRKAVPDTIKLPIESPRGDYVVFDAGPRELFAVGRDVEGRRRSPGGVVERLAGERMTSRAWSTVERIVHALS